MTEEIPDFTLTATPQHEAMNKTGMKIGRHFGPGGKYILATLGQALDAPASAMQLFGGNPHRHWCSHTTDEDRDKFVELSSHMYKVVHAPYITNIADNPSARNWRMTQHCLVNQLEWAERHACDSVVFHPGSPKDASRDDGLQWSYEALKNIFQEYQGPVKLLLENAAHRKKIGGKIEDLTDLCSRVGDSRLGICIDTTHAYASGYDVGEVCDQIVNTPYLQLVHFNQPDHGVNLGNMKDRHSSTFLDGHLPFDRLKRIFSAARQRQINSAKYLPLILEGTPDLPADLVWLLSWEREQRTGVPAPQPAPAECTALSFDSDVL